MGLPLSGSPLVIPSFHLTAVDDFCLAHIPLNRGGAWRCCMSQDVVESNTPNMVDDV